MGALYIGGAVLYASKVPERWYKPPCEFNGIYLFCQCVGFLVNSITPFLQAIPYGTSSLSSQVRPFLSFITFCDAYFFLTGWMQMYACFWSYQYRMEHPC